MHKSINDSSKKGTDRAQKVYVGPLLIFSSVVLQVVFGILPFALSHFSLEEGWGMSFPGRTTFWITKMFQQGLCGLNSSSCCLCSGNWEEWREGGCRGWCCQGNGNTALERIPWPLLCPCSCWGWSTHDVGQLRIRDYTSKPEAIVSLSTFLLWEVGVWCCSAFCGHTR